eukprot:jgi/Galph1/4740/GphlegSOOS_G3373.1
MASIGTGYDLSATTFSPDGRVFQVEYSQKAADNSGLTVGICCSDGVVLAVEKIIYSKMLLNDSGRRVFLIDQHAVLAVAGMGPDGRQLVTRARLECEQYRNIFRAPMPGHLLAERLAGYVHLHTLYWHVRPFGCSVLVATWELTQGPALYMIEPSGTFYRYYGCAAGKAKQGAKTTLEKLDFQQLTCQNALLELAKIIHTAHDETKDKPYELEMVWITAEGGKASLVSQTLIQAARNGAEEMAREEEMAD